jgi:hypothetical protein
MDASTIATVIGSNFFVALVSITATYMQVGQTAKERKGRRLSKPLLNLRLELAVAAAKQERLLQAANMRVISIGITGEEITKLLKEAVNDWNEYYRSGKLTQTLFMLDDKELIDKAEEVIKDYQESWFTTINYQSFDVSKLPEARKVFERNKNKIAWIQSLINAKLRSL